MYSRTPLPPRILLWFIWSALTLSLGTYLFICLFISKDNIREEIAHLKMVANIVPIVLASISILIYRLKLNRELREQSLKNEGEEYLKKTIIFFILCWALNESITIAGFLNAFLVGPGTKIIPYALTSLILNLAMMPIFPKNSEQSKLE